MNRALSSLDLDRTVTLFMYIPDCEKKLEQCLECLIVPQYMYQICHVLPQVLYMLTNMHEQKWKDISLPIE